MMQRQSVYCRQRGQAMSKFLVLASTMLIAVFFGVVSLTGR